MPLGEGKLREFHQRLARVMASEVEAMAEQLDDEEPLLSEGFEEVAIALWGLIERVEERLPSQ